MTDKPKERTQRLLIANDLIETIASCGRRFFYHKGRVSRFEFAENGRLWFIDSYSEKRIYTHVPPYARFKGFTQGGTLRRLVFALRDYIMKGTRPSYSNFFWRSHYCDGDVWGYGEDLAIVQSKAREVFGYE